METPWGKMWKIIRVKKFWLKFIVVKGKTSLQLHKERNEWFIGIFKTKSGEKHRLLRGAYLEFAFGKPREDDIVRFEDDYGRCGPKIVAVSGGFDPIHVGHIRLFEEAKKLGNKLVVILNGDSWLMRKKGKIFMPAGERAEIIQALKPVDEVFVYESDKDDVCEALEILKPAIFANGGDRRSEEDIPEAETCKKLGIEMIFNVGGGKIRSSSGLLRNYSGLIKEEK